MLQLHEMFVQLEFENGYFSLKILKGGSREMKDLGDSVYILMEKTLS